MVAYDGNSPSAAAKKSTANDLGADLDLSQLLEPSDVVVPNADSGIRPRDAYGQSLPTGDDLPCAAEPAATPWHMMTRPLKVSTPKEEVGSASANLRASAQSPALYEGDFDLGLAAFCKGAGIEPRSLSTEARHSALLQAGQLLREAILGLMDLNQSRNDFRNRFRIPAPPGDAPESPLNFSKGVDEAVVRLLNNLSTRAGSVEAIRTNFRELKGQNTAALTAMHVAFEEFLSQVNPKELEDRFERATKRSVFGTQSKTKYWDLYSEMFSGLAQRPEDGFPHVFVEAFAKAYQAKLRKLVPPRRSGIGVDRVRPTDPNEQAVGGDI